MKKTIALLLWFVGTSVSFADVSLVDRVHGYLAARNIEYSDYAVAGKLLVVTDSAGFTSIALWPSELGPKPELSDLPSDASVIVAAKQQFELTKQLQRQSRKSAALKAAESAMVSYLKSENAIAADAKTVTKAELVSLFASWSDLPDEQAELKYSKYARFLKRIELAGGSESDIWEH